MARAHRLKITLLGAPRIERDDVPVAFDTRKAIALLAYVAVAGRQRREALAALLWPDADDARARGALRRTLSVLRAGIGADRLRVERDAVELTGPHIDVDVHRFRDLLTAAASHADAPGVACRSCIRNLRAAVRLSGGDLLAGFALRDSPAFDDWQYYEAEGLRRELAGALDRLVDLELADGDTAAAVALARRRLALDPLHEPTQRALMLLHARAGDRAAAVRAYRDGVRVLDEELAVAPLPETTRLYEAIVAGEVTPEPLSSPPSARPLSANRTRADDGLLPPAEAAPAMDRADGSRASMRIESLAPVARQVLSAAAVLGDEIEPDAVREVSGRSEDEVVAAIEELVERGILREPADTGSPDAYRLADADLRTKALESVSHARIRLLHSRAAEALRKRTGATPWRARDATRIAGHLAAAGRDADATAFHLQAASAARRAYAHVEAVDHYRAALALGAVDQPAPVHAAIGDVEAIRGRYGEALIEFERAAAHASVDQLPTLEHRLGTLHLRLGAWGMAEQHLAAALAAWPRPDRAGRARVLADLALAEHRSRALDAASRHADEAVRVARASRDAVARAQAHNLRAILARAAGDLGRARAELATALGLSSAIGEPSIRVAILNNAALVERDATDLQRAVALTDEALALCVATGDRHRQAALLSNLADLLHLLGRRRESDAAVAESAAIFAEIGEPGRLQPEIWKLVEW